MLLHLVDGTADEPGRDWNTVMRELHAYGGPLADKPMVTVLNKVDALDSELIDMQKSDLEAATGGPVLTMSGAAGIGVTDVLRALAPHVRERRAAERAVDAPEEDPTWRP